MANRQENQSTTVVPGAPAATTAVGKLLRGEDLPTDMLGLITGPVARAVAEAADFAAGSLADATLEAYAADWGHFVAWCRASGIASLPASPVVVAGYLASLATTLRRSGLKRRLAAIAHYHRAAGHAWLPGHPAIRATLRGILKEHGTPSRPAAALTSEDIRKLLDTCRSDLTGMRDRALFLVGFAGALRRSELVAMDREHLRFTDKGLALRLLRSEAKPTRKRRGLISASRALAPVLPVRCEPSRPGCTAVASNTGRCFAKSALPVGWKGRLTPDGVWKILRRRAAQAELTVHASERLSPHGLRAGLSAAASIRI
jgi:integrase